MENTYLIELLLIYYHMLKVYVMYVLYIFLFWQYTNTNI